MAALLFLQPAKQELFLPDSIRVVQQILVLYVLVRIQVGQHSLFLQLFSCTMKAAFGQLFLFHLSSIQKQCLLLGMDFYKLTNFQLYSIIHSRHLDKENKVQAKRELERRNLSEEELQQLADELKEKTKKEQPANLISPNVVYLIIAVVALLLLRQCLYR